MIQPAGRAVAHRHVRPQAGGPGRVPRRVQADPHQRARRADLRALPAAGPHVGQVRRDPLASSAAPEHSDSQTNTGYTEFENRTAHHPSLGAVVSKLRGSQDSDIPPFVSLRGMARRHRARLPGRRPSAVHAGRPRLGRTCACRAESMPKRGDDRKALLASFDDAAPRPGRQRHHARDGQLQGAGV